MDKRELATKEKRVRTFLRKKRLDGVLLSRQDSFAWFTCGGDNHVVTASEAGVATLLVMPDRKVLFSNNIEVPRIMDEELAGIDCGVIQYPWHEEKDAKVRAIKKAVRGLKVASDDGIGGTPLLDADFKALRYSLTDQEIERYRALGKDCNAALEEVGHKLKQGQTEHRIAADICRAFIARDIQPFVCLIAADDRVRKYRHPIYKNRKATEQVEIVMCGRRGGLILSLTRLIHFGRLPDDLRRKHEACCAVDAAFNLSTKPGTSLSTVLRNAVSVYRQTGFAQEWTLHHQGGPTGYAGRDVIATPGDKTRIRPNQAFAWNPSITGTKSEDTILALKNGIEVLSGPVNWPTVQAEWKGQTLERADILVR